MAEKTPLHVLIIGSGLSGLTIAHSLAKAGISYEIFEKSLEHLSVSRTRDWGITLHWGSTLLTQCFPDNILSKLDTAQVDPFHQQTGVEKVTVINIETGKHIKEIPLGDARRLSHKKLRALISQGLNVKYDKSLESVVYKPDGVKAQFKDGTTAKGSLLVAADGAHSPFREGLIGKEQSALTTMSFTVNNFFTTYDAEKAIFIRDRLHPLLDMGIHPNGTFFALVLLDVPSQDKPETWKFQIFVSFPGELTPEESSSAARLRLIKDRAKDFAEPFRSAALWISEGHEIHNDKLAFWDVKPWDNHSGKVTLAGDAAHPFPPHRGQGVNNCLQDACNLTDALGRVMRKEASVEEAVAQYDADLLARSKAEMALSVKQATLMHRWEDLMKSPLMTIGAVRASSS